MENLKPFIALDGEGYTNSEGKHLYNLLAASDNSYIHNDEGLATRECLEYLLELKKRNPNAIFISFVFSYDVNMMLKDLDARALKSLGKNRFCHIYDGNEFGLCYKLEYLPRKSFYIAKGVKTEKKFKVLNSIKIYDVWGFFQSSFVNALKMFHIGEDILPFIESMKDNRDGFTATDFDKILEYNGYECSLLVELMNTVRKKMYQVNIPINQWHGAGAVAGAILKREKVKEHLFSPPEDTDLHTAVMSAYFGGRIQNLQVGEFDKTYSYDIVSAYPASMAELPSLRNVRTREVKNFEEDSKMAVYQVEWAIPLDNKITPFPFRDSKGGIQWPYSAEGYYWYPEVKAALDVYGSDAIKIIKGYVFDIAEDSKPFHFIYSMFEERKIYKAKNDMAQLCIKLGLNSLYGKTAQGLGYKASKPAYQCYIYAGYITSVTRSKMFRAAMLNQDKIISFATDGLTSQVPLDLKEGKELGDWELNEYNDSFFIKPGFYTLGNTVKKVRGFAPSSVDYSKLREVWRDKGVNGSVKCPTRTFIGMRSASVNRPFCSWLDEDRELSFYPMRGVPVYLESEESYIRYRIIPPYVLDGVSAKYAKKIITDENYLSDEEYVLKHD